jgi:hypothetical protein
MNNDWWVVKAQARVTKAEFDFAKGMWTVTGYIDFDGPDSMDSMVCGEGPHGGKEFKHSWFTFGEDYNALEKILIRKCGDDLLGPQRTMSTLKKEKFDD